MMQVLNPQQVPVSEIAERLRNNYPQTVVKKIFGREQLWIPVDNFKVMVRSRKSKLTIDFQPPIAWTIGAFVGCIIVFSLVITAIVGTPVVAGFGGVLPILIAIVGVKAVFKSKRKDFFERFQQDLEAATLGSSDSVLY